MDETERKPKKMEPVFAVVGTAFTLHSREQVLAMLEKNREMQGPGNIKAGAMFAAAADQFREWSRVSEPGWAFLAAELQLVIVRLAATAPRFRFDPTAEKPALKIANGQP